jgi:hypothetical protein
VSALAEFPSANVLLVKLASTLAATSLPVLSTSKPSSIFGQNNAPPQRVAHQARVLVRRVYDLYVVVEIWAAGWEPVVCWARILGHV